MTTSLPFQFQDMQKNMAARLDITSMPDSDQQEIMAEVGQNIMRRIVVEMINLLPDNKKTEFADRIEQGDEMGTLQLLNDSIPGVDEILQKLINEEIDIARNLIAV